jgi:hypothetical protein
MEVPVGDFLARQIDIKNEKCKKITIEAQILLEQEKFSGLNNKILDPDYHVLIRHLYPDDYHEQRDFQYYSDKFDFPQEPVLQYQANLLREVLSIQKKKPIQLKRYIETLEDQMKRYQEEIKYPEFLLEERKKMMEDLKGIEVKLNFSKMIKNNHSQWETDFEKRNSDYYGSCLEFVKNCVVKIRMDKVTELKTDISKLSTIQQFVMKEALVPSTPNESQKQGISPKMG